MFTITTYNVSGSSIDEAEADTFEALLLAAKTLTEESITPLARISIRLKPGWALLQGELRYSDRWL